VEVTVLRSGIPQNLPGRLVDGGMGGLSVVLAGNVHIGESIGIEFSLPNVSELLQARARVRYQDRVRCGLEFSTLNPAKLEMIRQWAETGHALMVSAVDTAKIAPAPGAPAPGAHAHGAYTPGELSFLAARPVPKWSRRRTKRRSSLLPLGLLFLALVAVGGLWAYRHPALLAKALMAPERPAVTVAPEVPPQRMIVAADVMQSLIRYRTMPIYPEAARGKNIEGGVLLDTVIGKDGRVLDVQLISGPPELAPAAMDAVKNWRFSPFTLNGAAVEVETTIEVAFRLQDR
jgi:TonB family protein